MRGLSMCVYAKRSKTEVLWWWVRGSEGYRSRLCKHRGDLRQIEESKVGACRPLALPSAHLKQSASASWSVDLIALLELPPLSGLQERCKITMAAEKTQHC